MERVCTVCSATFTPHRVGRNQRCFSVRHTCSSACQSALIIHCRLNAAPWSEAEIDKLSELVGDLPISLLYPIYLEWAQAQGHPHRTMAAVRIRSQKLSPSIVSVGEWLQVGDVARFSGATRYQVARWIRQGYVESSRWPDRKGGFYYIQRSSLRRMVKTHPAGFDLADRDGLWALLEDHKLVDWILATRADRQAGRRPTGQAKPVVKVATGQRYRSVNHAAVVHGSNRWGVLRSIKSGGRLLLGGSAWAYAS